ncbi:hypothetical protein BEWA_022120 [Theileria equi strain WA]|uniref:Signal peptide-containing protein n=1 Tax=Theileria equi strain WA TaxID=1537102 RepID=L0AWU1_THEEQ|nr:hypothetical protein BEWA_022120 [Theileria equi strain WA]AFZ79364.1 hypothetical protein BEWA_022120 [Theileria equi strain WA]|eukprot:XP_004829030.1 hypothetical protein BEWA_022120 [Theileria equi strain WA]
MYLLTLITVLALVAVLWNEINLSMNIRAVNDVTKASCVPSSENNGKIVHFTCDLSSSSVFYTPREFSNNIYSHNGIFLETKVEMYQWISHVGVFGKYYSGEFVDHIVDNGILNVFYKNPQFFPNIPGAGRMYTSKIKIGGYTIPKDSFVDIHEKQQLKLTDNMWYQPNIALPILDVNHLNTQVHGDALYTGDPLNPKIGDLRITFWGSTSTRFSIIGRQNASLLKDYSIEPIHFMDREMVLLSEGEYSVKALEAKILNKFESTESFNWGLRIFAFFLISYTIYVYYLSLKAPRSEMAIFVCSICAGGILICVAEAVIWFYREIYGPIMLLFTASALFAVLITTWKLNLFAKQYMRIDSSYFGLHSTYDSVRWSTASPTASIAVSSDQPLISSRNL